LVARRIFIQLVRPGEGTEDTRRLAARAEFDESTWVLVGQLADSRLLITGRDVAGAETVEVVHEALIRSWVRLREWMTDDRTFRVWQERLRAVLHQWEGTDRDEGALLRGVSLAAAEGWFAERPEDLSPAEVNYIRASVALRERRTAEREQAEAAHQQRERTLRDSRARRLAAQALISNDEPAERAAGLPLLLAREAILTTLTGDGYSLPEATDALRKAILTAPASPLRRLTGHHAPVKTVVFSPDGTSILTAAADGTAGVWDSQTGQVRLMLTGHRDALSTALFSPDGRLIVTAGDDPVAKVWDAQTGQLRHELVGHRNWLQAAAFSPDSSLIATGSRIVTAKSDGTLMTGMGRPGKHSIPCAAMPVRCGRLCSARMAAALCRPVKIIRLASGMLERVGSCMVWGDTRM
jgi:WD40 repeat protein